MKFFNKDYELKDEDNSLNFLRKHIGILGESFLAGSSAKYKSFKREHDLDIGIITPMKSKFFIKGICTNAIKNWIKYENFYPLPLHFIIIGNFNPEYCFIKINDKEHIIQFVNKKARYFSWAQTSFLKYLKLKSKKSIVMKRIYSWMMSLLLWLKKNF